MNIRILGLVLAVFCTGLVSAQQRGNKLTRLSIDPNTITVSGVSAGGFMAVQMHVALSTVFKGVASVAGGVYWCAQGNAATAQTTCMKNPTAINTTSFLKKAKSEEAAGKIEKLENLKNSRVYIYAGKNDSILLPASSDKLYEFYSKFTSTKNIKYKNDVSSGHGWITNNYGGSCGSQASPWISNCNYDMAGDVLTQMYGPLLPPNKTSTAVKKQLYTFDQSEFQTGNSSLYQTGFVYVPIACQSTRSNCRLHVNFHGCQMGPNYIEDKYVSNNGLNKWAEANKIVVLYPQATSSVISNPYGCWDWFGYTGSDYVNKNGPQIIAIQKMVYRLLGKF